MSFPHRLQSLRSQYGYSQAQIAAHLSISRMTYTQYESGQREPDITTLLHLSALYHVSLDYLLGISDIPQPSSPCWEQAFLLSQLPRLSSARQTKLFTQLQQLLGEQILEGDADTDLP